jgi:hypothetical protein
LACRANTRDFCCAFAALAEQYKTFFLTIHYLQHFIPIAQQAAVRQACRKPSSKKISEIGKKWIF